ncbi:hypothetical protein ACKKBG_A18085 [Auxenochlorella protothecoides x Auxenochlorella symbiontica]
MTEFWVSQANHWCEYCKVWLKDTAQSRAVHEKGIKHQENVAKRLSAMRRKAVDEKAAAVQTAKTMKAIEEEAAAQFARDRAEAAAHRAASLGEWVLNHETGQHYNAQHRWYYDSGSKMYYGGDPPDWTASPATLPHAARFEVMYPPLTRPRPTPGQGPPAAASAAGARASGRAAAHPLSGLGGYAMPSVGRIGGAKGVGRVEAKATDAQRKHADKLKAKKAIGKDLPKQEQEALARREAARARVQQRTMSAFGLQ